MKKLLALLMVFALSVGAVGCVGQDLTEEKEERPKRTQMKANRRKR